MSNQFPPPQGPPNNGQPPQGPPPQYGYPQGGYQQGPPPKKKHTVRNIFLGITLVLVLLVGGCTALFVATVDTNGDFSSTQSKVEDSSPSTGTNSKQKSAPKATTGQANALRAAKNYLSFAPFSRKGLIRQLTSDAGDKYPRADAVYAVNHVGANWNEQAAKAAKNYLKMSPFSRAGMIQQLTSSAGDQYTQAQAEYGATKAGLK